ncbi:hypothetical protein Taro_007366 [Colocasia esculenta]|uniref:Uncharacterized protein n=1 Tax=Colocasia esculenta TaxID=4460 RepID=A0A843TXY7_COLES|nr:hypothetical protein [Colocasia esculenta]
MGLRQCGPQEWCWLDSTVSWFVVVGRQLDLSSVAVRLRGSPVWFVWVDSWCRKPVFVARVKESKKLLILCLVPSRTVAGQGLHLQQLISFIFLRTCVNDIPCEASARS